MSVNIIKIINKVLQRFMSNDSDLITRRAHEQSISQRLARYLEDELFDWQVNCEYNRQGEGNNPKKDSSGAKRRPDIIVHERGNDNRNLLVIEVKPAWEDQLKVEKDRENLRRMLLPPHSYRYAILILYSDTPNIKIWFEPIN